MWFNEYLLVLLLAFSLLNCSNSSPKEKASDAAAVEMARQTAELDELKVDEEGKKVSFSKDNEHYAFDGAQDTWPAEIPAAVPAVKNYKIVGSASNSGPDGESWTVMMEGGSPEFLEEYQQKLDKAGFKTAIFKLDGGGTVSGEKDKLVVSAILSDTQLILSIQQKK
jgi:hypothetical protein